MTEAPAGQSAGTIPASVDALAAALIVLYADAESELLDDLAQTARSIAPDLTNRVELAAQMRRTAQRIAAQLATRSGTLADHVIAEAAARGDAAALTALRQAVAGHPDLLRRYLVEGGHADASAQAIAFDLASRLDAVQRRIVRFADDAYRAAVADAASRLVAGTEGLTPATAQRLAWRNLTRDGITGFVDARGHRWNLASYVEVATRTAVQRAYNTSHQDRMTALGIEFFTISHSGRPCPLCHPFEGAILSTGPVGLVRAPAADSDRTVSFRVKATVDQARAAGLFHPNCKHVLLPYLPGVTRLVRSLPWSAVDERRYQATQRLRGLERRVRAAKRERAASLDELARQRADRAIRATQARIRAHVDQHGLNRRRRREQLDLGNR